MKQQVIFTDDIQATLAEAVKAIPHDRLFVLTDSTTHEACWPRIAPILSDVQKPIIQIPAGDTHKDLQSLTTVWTALQKGGATRHSLLVNLGGGMVTDLGGFAASTFKRGLHFINIPTTLLAMVDASVGGKTGINFGGLKNEVGTFCDADRVIICTDFLLTLDRDNLLSGYAEMLKHGLIANRETWAALLNFEVENCSAIETSKTSSASSTRKAREAREELSSLLQASVAVKARIVEEDPHEQGIRKALNLGHTVGHAIESWGMEHHPILHGHAVALGLVAELYLACIKTHFPTETMRQTVQYLRAHYPVPAIACDDYPALLALMRHDKKNTAGEINFTLLADIGNIRINQLATDDEICEALDFLREG